MENASGGEPNTTDTIDVLKCLRCRQEGCSNVPGFGYHGEGPTLCSEHATPAMVQLVALRCEQPGCNARRTFGFDGGDARLCANHKLDGMVDLMKRRSQCVISNCTKLSTYGFDGLLARYCFSHKSSGMVYLKNRKRCEFYECTRQPTYGMDGQRAKFCSSHKQEGMIDVKNCRCKHPGCTRQPNYGHEGGRAKYCSSHKLAKMVNVVSRRCEFPACKRQPIYGYEGEKATFCPMHRLDNMIDVVNRHCEYAGCTKTPSYGYVGERAQFCSHHHLPDMEDVKNRRCEWHECRRYPIFGHEGERARFCSAHKSNDMVNVRNRRCEDGGCNKLPTHGFLGEKAKACELHAHPGMVNLKGRKSVPAPTITKREGDVNIRLGPMTMPLAGVGFGSKSGRSPEHEFDEGGLLGSEGGVPPVALGGGGSASGQPGDRPDQIGGFWGLGHRGGGGRGAAAAAGSVGGGRGPLCDESDMFGGNEGPMMGWGAEMGMRGGAMGLAGGDGASANVRASPTGVLGDRKFSIQESQQARLRRLEAEVELRDQRVRQEQELKEQQMRAMQSGLHRRTLAPAVLDQNFYGSPGEYTQSHGQLGASHRPQQQHFVQGGGSSSGMIQRRPLPRDEVRSSSSPQVQAYRDHPQQQQQQQQSRGYGNPPDYGFLDPQKSSHGYSQIQGYGSGTVGEGGVSSEAPIHNLPVSGVLEGRVNLRPPQPRIPVQHPRARRPLPPSPTVGRGVPGIPTVMDGGLSLEGGRRGGNLSPFLGPQSSSHLRPSLPPVVSSATFAQPFQPLEWDAGGQSAHGDAGAGGGGAGDGSGGHGGQHVEYSHQGAGGGIGMGGANMGGNDDRGNAEAAAAGSLDMAGSGSGGAGAGTAGNAVASGSFGGRLQGVDLGQGMMHHFGHDVSPAPFIATEVNGGGGSHSHGAVVGSASMSSPPGSVNDVSAVGVAARPLSPLMATLGDSAESPPDLPRLRSLNSSRGQDHPSQSSFAPPYLSGSSSSALASSNLAGMQHHPHSIGVPQHPPGVGSGRPSPAPFEALAGPMSGGGGGVVRSNDSGDGRGGVSNTGTSSSQGRLSTRVGGSIDGRSSRDSRGGGGGQARGLYPVSSSGIGGASGRSFVEGNVAGSGDDGVGGGNDEGDGDDARKRLRIEELLH